MAIIEARHITKVYPKRRGTRVMLGRGGMADWLRGRKAETFKALDDVSLSVDAGQSLGIIGRNGSGKSTLLKILSGITLPSGGHVIVRGRVASLLELGAGFHPMLTGRENIYLNAGLLGMRHAQVDAVIDEIIEFSGIGAFIDQPVDTYSSGMYVRIGFAVAAYTNPDIFLVDEVLSVGDEEFQRKCRRRIGELREQGKTIVFVSHDLGTANALCERIVLLDKGRLIIRDTPQKTITFYLRQVGEESGVHNFVTGEAEAIHCDGRISLFRRGEEVTASNGLWMQLESLGQHYNSSDAAEWEVTERSDTSCVASGRMTRLPITFHWDLRLEEDRLIWKASLFCERETSLTSIYTHLSIPTEYERWIYGDLSGPFPEILPSDVTWNTLVAPEQEATDAAALPRGESARPPLLFKLRKCCAGIRMFWSNSDYSLFSRMLSLHARFPETDAAFAAGRHDLFTIEIAWTENTASLLEQVRSERVVTAGALTARFEQGRIRLAVDGDELTDFLHVYSSILIDCLWNDSPQLQWGGVRGDGRRLTAAGASRRFPFKQHWEMEALDDAIGLRIWLEAEDDFEVQEYHVSTVLQAGYEHWRTDTESGNFPPFDPALDQWQHLNRSYQPGHSAAATAPALPAVIIKLSEDSPEFCFTPINTKAKEHARVIQALRPSGAGALRFEKGRHLFFAGVIRCEAPESA